MNKNSSRLENDLHSSGKEHAVSMFRITTEKKRGKVILTVEGRLAAQGVSTFEQCWRELRGDSPQEKFSINLCGVTFIDAAGRALLKEIHREGGRLVADGCVDQFIVKEVVGSADGGKNKEEESGEGKQRGKGSHIIFYGLLFGRLLGSSASRAQDKPQGTTPPASGEVLRLTLDQAVATALKQNTTARVAVLTATQSEQDQKIALSQLLPQAEFGLSEEWQRVNILAQFGGTRIFPGLPGHVGPYSIFSAGPSVNGPLFDLTLFRRYQASRNAANASRAESLSTREQVILLVVSQYIGTLRSIADVQASQSRWTWHKRSITRPRICKKKGSARALIRCALTWS